MKVMFSKHEDHYNIHQWDETLQLLTLWLVLCTFEEALNQYILQSIFFNHMYCGPVNATSKGETDLLLISKEINCSSMFDRFHKPKCFAFFIINHGCIVVNVNYIFSMPCLFVEICGIDIVCIWVWSQANEPTMTKDSKIVVLFVVFYSLIKTTFGMKSFRILY